MFSRRVAVQIQGFCPT